MLEQQKQIGKSLEAIFLELRNWESISRIGPTPEHGRSCRSAHEQADSGGTESPDPLEPWSTKKIENMNKILAWENDHDSLWFNNRLLNHEWILN